MNKVILVGRLVKDPEVKSTQSQVAVCSFTLAVDRKFKTAGGERQSDSISFAGMASAGRIPRQVFSEGIEDRHCRQFAEQIL